MSTRADESEERPLRVVVADDDPLVLAITRRLLLRNGYEVVPCDDARTALREVIQSAPFALIADLHMPEINGAELLRLVRSLAPRTRRILYTGECQVGEVARAIAPLVADAIVAKADGIERLPLVLSGLRAEQGDASQPEQARSLALGMARAFAMGQMESEDRVVRAARSARQLGALAGFDECALLDLEVGALLHDVGMICVPEAALRSPGPLSDLAWQQVHLHPRVGVDMLRECELFAGALPVVLHHHERFDGRGYPARLSGQEIPLPARVFAVVDTYEAMTRSRAYAPPVSVAEARQELVHVSGSQLDPALVELFLSLDPDDWNRPLTPASDRPEA